VLHTLRDSLKLLASRRFGTFWVASLLSSIGTWAQLVAEPWLLLSLGASSFLIGLDSFAMNAPVWLLTMVGGVLADRSDRRRVITWFQSIQMLCPTAIVVLILSGRTAPWIIIALSAVVGITDALSMPSFQSIVPAIVEHEQIGAGLALNATQFNLSRIVGPVLAGVLMARVGVTACFAVSAASYLPFIGIALWILPRRTSSAAAAAGAWQRPLAGVQDLLRQRHLRGALLTVSVTSVLCAPLVTFVPVLIQAVFHGTASQFSLAIAAFGAGGLAGAATLLAIPPQVDRRILSAGLSTVYALILILLGATRWFWSVPVLLAVAGGAMAISSTAANFLLQSTVSRRLLGQAASLYMLALRGGMSLGAVLTGAGVTLLGVQRTLLINGVAAAILVALVARSWLATPLPEVEVPG
jgi:predicted MFS family arabinose efflux permease